MKQNDIKPNDYSRVIVTCMKDEAPYMLDWISYHLSIGFTHFVIFTNDCSDGTDKLCRHLATLGIVSHFNNKEPYPKGIQKTAYQRMKSKEPVQNAEWLMALDVDEYVRIDVGDGHLDDVFEIMPENMSALSFVWQVFGNNGVKELSTDHVADLFTRSASHAQIHPYQIRGLKTLYRNALFGKIGTHRPAQALKDEIENYQWFDANGVDLSGYYTKPYWMALPNGLGFGFVLGRVNHYAIRSREAFFLKMQRGFVNRSSAGIRGEGSPALYWMYFNWNMIKNEHPLKKLKDAKTLKSELECDAKTMRLADRAFDFHKQSYEDLYKTADWIEPEIERIEALGDGRSFDKFDQSTLEHPIRDWYLLRIHLETLASKSIFDPNLLLNKVKMK